MSKQIVVTALGNRIEYATTNGKGLITGKREDITDEAIKAVFQHLMGEHKAHDRGQKSFGYVFEGLGEIHYHSPKKIERVKEDAERD
jgi:DNA helicase IV